MARKKHSVGIVGLGFGRAHIPAFQANGCEVVAVCQRNQETARAVFAVLLVGATRATDLRKAERPAAAGVLLGVSVAAGLACIAAVAFGISVIVSK